jgi:DNA-directed RNA polymerase specialized sigma24 family protein
VALNHGRKRYRQGAHRTNQHPGYGVRLEAAPKHLDELPHPAPAANDAPVGPDGRLHEDQVIFDDLLMAELREIAAVPRACLLMRSLLELSYREISEALDIPEGTAMSHVHRTRTQLRRRLGAPEEDPADTERRDGRRLRLDIATANLADSRSTIDAETR